MVKVELETSTLAVLLAGLYCTFHEVNSLAIPESLYLSIAEKLEYFLPDWDYTKISFEDWVKYELTILPKAMLSDEDLEYLMNNTLYWETMNGNALLVVSMNINDINGK